jgi:DNA-binding CsgD family transcriptional regulator
VTLTDRQRQILQLIAAGRTHAEIGRQLYLTEDTVKTHLARIYTKIGATNAANAVDIGHRRRLLTRIGCGTIAGYRRHQRQHEPACDDCREAMRLKSAARRATARRQRRAA